MEIIKLPDYVVGDQKDAVNIFYYLRAKGPDQIKLKINYAQNMLCFMVKGMKELIDETDRYAMNEEQIGLISSGNMLMNERVTLRQEFESLLLFFSNEFLSGFLKKYDLRIGDQEENSRPVITFPKDDYLLNFQHSMKILEQDMSRRNFRIAKMEELLLYLYEKYPTPMLGFIAHSITKAKNRSMVQVIQNHLFDNLNSHELAFLCNMSISTFKRKFFEVYETTPKKYIISQKMKQAVFFLQSQKRPSEIYYELGYENLSSFSKEFKKHFGVSPTAYSAQG